MRNKEFYNPKPRGIPDRELQEEIEEAQGKSSQELGIYNREEIEKKFHNFYEKISQMPEFQFIKNLKKAYPEANVYAVGGSVRDLILEKESSDIDLVVNGIEASSLVDYLLNNHYGKIIFDRNPKANLKKMTKEEKEKLIKEEYGVLKFHPQNSNLKEPIDIALTRLDYYDKESENFIPGIKRSARAIADPRLNINEDLERRDLTINAMAINLTSGEIIDPHEGIDDLVKRQIRAVGEPLHRLEEDVSRGFRAIRFAAVIDGNIEKNTKQAIKKIFKPLGYSSVKMNLENIENLKNKVKNNQSKKLPSQKEQVLIKKTVTTLLNLNKISMTEIYQNQLSKLDKIIENNFTQFHVKKNLKSKIRNATKFDAGETPEYYEKKLNEIKESLGEIEKIEPQLKDTGKAIFHKLKQAHALSPTDMALSHLDHLSLQIQKEDQKIRQEYNLEKAKPEDIPWFLQIYCDKEKNGIPKRAVSRQTLRIEILKAIQANPEKLVKLLDEVGGLKYIFPELKNLQNLSQGKEHHSEGDAFTHTLLLFKNLPKDTSLRVKLAALFHDLGKADTWKKHPEVNLYSQDKNLSKKSVKYVKELKNKTSKITFYGHEDESVKHIEKIAKKLNFNKQLKKDIIWLVQNHMQPLSTNTEKMASKKFTEIFLRSGHFWGLSLDLVKLAKADVLSSKPAKGSPNLSQVKLFEKRLHELKNKFPPKSKEDKNIIKLEKLVSGDDLIKKFKLNPGPIFKKILEKIEEEQLEGKIETREQALKRVRELI